MSEDIFRMLHRAFGRADDQLKSLKEFIKPLKAKPSDH
jgi:hypothetical protein